MKMLQWQTSGDHVRSCCVKHLHVDSVCGEVMGMCSVPEVRFSRRRLHTNIASN